MKDDRARQLISELMADPQAFDASGRAHELLQAYLEGFSPDTLRTLLRSDNMSVQRTAAFIASELGGQARTLLDDVVPLLSSVDRHIQNYAMEVLTVCSEGVNTEKFAHVARQLESADAGLRLQAMDLVSNATASQLEAAACSFQGDDRNQEAHRHGLRAAVSEEDIEVPAILAMLHSASPVTRRYGAIVARRLARRFPQLVQEVASTGDPELLAFLQD